MCILIMSDTDCFLPVLVQFREGNVPGESKKITYKELLQEVCKFANVLKDKGRNCAFIVNSAHTHSYQIGELGNEINYEITCPFHQQCQAIEGYEYCSVWIILCVAAMFPKSLTYLMAFPVRSAHY